MRSLGCGFEEDRLPSRSTTSGFFAVPRGDGAGRCPPGPRNECAGGRTKAAAKRVARVSAPGGRSVPALWLSRNPRGQKRARRLLYTTAPTMPQEVSFYCRARIKRSYSVPKSGWIKLATPRVRVKSVGSLVMSAGLPVASEGPPRQRRAARALCSKPACVKSRSRRGPFR